MTSPSPLAEQIRAELRRYLAGEITWRQFDEWFVPATWDIDPNADPEAIALTGQILGRTAEHQHGDWTKDELRKHLRRLAASPRPTKVRTVRSLVVR